VECSFFLGGRDLGSPLPGRFKEFSGDVEPERWKNVPEVTAISVFNEMKI
jgi:hypothetical protein